MALEEELSLEITQALQSIQQIDDSLSAVADSFQKSVTDALNNISVSPEIDLQVNAQALNTVEDQLNNLSGNVDLQIQGEKQIQDEVQHVLDSADFTIEPQVDASALESQLQDVSQAVQDTGLSDFGAQAQDAAGGTQDLTKSALELGGALEVVRGGAELAGRSSAPLLGFLEGAGGAGVAAAAGISAFAIAGRDLISSARSAESAEQRFNLVFGKTAEEVDHINIAGLDESIGHLAIRLGQSEPAFLNAASKIGTIGKASGAAPEDIAKTTDAIAVLAARAAALDPTMKNAGASTQRLLFALARGGPALARFGIDIPVAELRQFAADQGLTFTQLSLFQRATLGADLALQKLGGTLSTDINAGAQNIDIQFRALRSEFEHTIETLGKPLLEPVLKTIEAAQPLLEELAAAFSAILQAVLPLAAALTQSLTPVIGALTVALGPALKLLGEFGKVLGDIPKPILEVATSIALAAVALPKLTALTKGIQALILTSKAAATSNGIGGLVAGIGEVPLAAGAAAVGIIGVQQELNALHKKEDADVSNFIGTEKQRLASHAVTVEQMTKDLKIINGQIDDLRTTAKKNKSPFDSDYRHELRAGADGLQKISDQYKEQIDLANQTAQATGLSADMLLRMIVAGQDISGVVSEAKQKQAEYNAELTGTASTMDELTRATIFGRDTANLFQKEIDETGIKAEDLQKQLDATTQEVDKFLQTFITGVPTLNSVLDQLDTKTSSTIEGITKSFQDQIKAAQTFQADLDVLAQAGAVNALTFFSTAGPEKAGAALDELVKKGHGAITEFEGIATKANQQSAALEERKKTLGQQIFSGQTAAQAQSKLDIEAKLHINLDDFSQQEQDFIIRTTVAGQQAGDAQAKAQAEAYKVSVTKSTTAAEFEQTLKDAGVVDAARSVGIESGIQLGEGLAVGLQDPKGLEAQVVKIKQDMTNIFNKIFQIHSPSKVTEDIGKLVAEGFSVGFSKGQTQAVEAAAELTSSVVDQFHLGIKDITDTGGQELDDFIARLKKAGGEVKAVQEDPRVKNALEKQALSALKAGGLSADELKKLVEKQNNEALKAFAATGLTTEQAQAIQQAQQAQAIVSRIGRLQDVSAAPVVDVTARDVSARNDALQTQITAAATEAAVQAALAAIGQQGPKVQIDNLSIPNQGETPEQTADTLSTVIEWSLQK
jgi:hypothetical protein